MVSISGGVGSKALALRLRSRLRLRLKQLSNMVSKLDIYLICFTWKILYQKRFWFGFHPLALSAAAEARKSFLEGKAYESAAPVKSSTVDDVEFSGTRFLEIKDYFL